MGINLRIPGDPEAIHAVADWLDPKLNNPVNGLHKGLRAMSSDSEMYWQGLSGEAFRQNVDAIATGVDPVDIYLADAAEVFRAYAQRLVRGKETFADYADEARKTWLAVVEDVIAIPMAPKQYVINAGDPPPIERGPNGECILPLPVGAYEDSLECYKRIAKDVGLWWGNLENWIDEHVVPLMNRIMEFQPLADAIEALKIGNGIIFNTNLGIMESNWESNLQFFEAKAKDAQSEYETHSQKLRSGDPAIKSAAESISKAELRGARDALKFEVNNLKIGTKIIPLVGPAIDIVSAGVEVANGGSISSASVGLAGGLIGGFVGAGIASGPPGWVALVVAALGAVGAWGAQWAWEKALPLDVREAIDAGDFGYAFQ